MQYDLKKIFEDKNLVSLTWHGEDTLVKLSKDDGHKTEVAKGDTVKVSVDIARFLLSYSDLWTLDGDEPVEQGWRKAREEAMKEQKQAPKKSTPEETGDVADLSPEAISKMKKPALLEALETLKVELDGDEKVPDLKELLFEAVEGVTEATDDAPDGDDDGGDEDESDEDAPDGDGENKDDE